MNIKEKMVITKIKFTDKEGTKRVDYASVYAPVSS